MSKSVKFSPTAVTKVFLHATKFPHCSVNGVLLSSKAESSVVTDTVPFFHDQLTLTPMLEVALCQVERYCLANSLEIAGYYQISESSSLDFVAHRVVDRINEHFPGAFWMSIDFKTFFASGGDFKSSCILQVNRDGKWTKLVSGQGADKGAGTFELLEVEPAVFSAGLKKLLLDDVQKELSDFDDHLDDVSLDWRNPRISNRISAAF